MIYIYVFTISTFFCFLSELFDKKKIIFLSIFFSICSIAIVSIFSGYRNDNIGTDMQIYGNFVFNYSLNFNSFKNFYNFSEGVFKLEPGYMLLNYIVSRLTNLPYNFYLVCATITQTLFYYSFKLMNKHISQTLGWISYLLLFYGSTFNIIRQSLALSIFLFGFSLLITNKNKIFSVTIILSSYLFHSSALIISLFVIALYYFILKSKNVEKFVNITIITSIFLFMFFTPFSNILMNSGILPQRYSVYLIGYSSGVGFSILSLLLKIIIGLIFLWRYNDLKSNKLFFFYICMFAFDFLFYQLRIVNVVFSRASYYFFVFQFISIPSVIKIIPEKTDKLTLTIIYLIFLLVTWYYQIVISGSNEIYPYQSNILGIY